MSTTPGGAPHRPGTATAGAPLTVTQERILSRGVYLLRTSGRLSPEDWRVVLPLVVAWAKRDAGWRPVPETAGEPLPERLLSRLATAHPFRLVPRCPGCGRRAIFPTEEYP